MTSTAASSRPAGSSSTSTSARARLAPSSYAAGGGSSSTSTSSAPLRRTSLYGTEDRIILSIGSSVSLIGLSGEARPRCIFRSLAHSLPPSLRPSPALEGWSSGSSKQRAEAKGKWKSLDEMQQMGLWDLDWARTKSDDQRAEKETLLLARLTHLLRGVFYRLLMADPKQRKVIVVEDPLLPSVVKTTMCKVLFDNLQVPSISFIPSPLLSLAATGRLTGLVLDVGHHSSTLAPVYFGRPMLHQHLLVSPLGGRRLTRRLRALLRVYGRYYAPISSFQGPHLPDRVRLGLIPPEVLGWDFVEEVKAKVLLVGRPREEGAPKEEERQDEKGSDTPQGEEMARGTTIDDDLQDDGVENDHATLRRVARRWSKDAKAANISMSVPTDPSSSLPRTETFQTSPPTLGNIAGASLGRGAIVVPGWVRERATEMFFDEGDEDEMSLVDLVCEALLKLPVDLRRAMASNILVTGGTSMIPNFVHRLRQEVISRLDASSSSSPSETSVPPLSLTRTRVALRGEGSTSTTRYAPIAHLASDVSFLNDHAPPIDASTRQAYGGTAPASFANNGLAWLGASLMGALKTGAMEEMTREAWDEANEAIAAAAAAAALAAGGGEAEGGRGTAASRPGFGAGRGSFVGIVGGIDTGAYGGLAAISRRITGPLSPGRG